MYVRFRYDKKILFYIKIKNKKGVIKLINFVCEFLGF